MCAVATLSCVLSYDMQYIERARLYDAICSCFTKLGAIPICNILWPPFGSKIKKYSSL